MEPTGSEEMVRRLDRLERAYRHWKYAGIVCMAFAIGSMAIVLASSVRWTAGAKLVEAQGFVLKDLKGERLANLGIRTNGYPLLTFYGKDGKPHIMIGSDTDNYSYVDIIGKEKSRTIILTNSDGSGGLNVYDQGGALRTSVGLEEGYATGLSVFDSAETNRAAFGMWNDRSAGMNVFNRSEAKRVSFGVKPDGTPTLLLRGASGETLFEEPRSGDDHGNAPPREK